jgi:hypothetical protein
MLDPTLGESDLITLFKTYNALLLVHRGAVFGLLTGIWNVISQCSAYACNSTIPIKAKYIAVIALCCWSIMV